jgi:hypothetical protein
MLTNARNLTLNDLHLLSAPLHHIPFGMIINGREVLFLKLDRSRPQSQYLKSIAYRLLDSPQERIQILNTSVSRF